MKRTARKPQRKGKPTRRPRPSKALLAFADDLGALLADIYLEDLQRKERDRQAHTVSTAPTKEV